MYLFLHTMVQMIWKIPVLFINENCFYDTGNKLNAYDTVDEHLKDGIAVILMNPTLYETSPVSADMLFEGLDKTTPVVLDPSFEGMSVFGDTCAEIVVIVKNGTPMRNKTIFNHLYVHDMSSGKEYAGFSCICKKP